MDRVRAHHEQQVAKWLRSLPPAERAKCSAMAKRALDGKRPAEHEPADLVSDDAADPDELGWDEG